MAYGPPFKKSLMKMLKTFYSANTLEAGCDEAGRGCLAGPVFAAAVILPNDFNHPLLNDSKKLSGKQREEAAAIVKEGAISYAVAQVDADEIDKINILNASILAMHKALDQLNPLPAFILVDGNRFKPFRNIKHICIVKGDGKYTSIAAASILAKTTRDYYMKALHKEFPAYCWDRNKGYPTMAHREAIMENGITPYHRRSFRLAGHQMRLNFS
jgi:ribonuclease HII